MTIDRYTKSVLTVIALGLLLNGLNPWIAPTKAYAELDLGDLGVISSNLGDIQMDVHRISNGQCSNRKLC